jgi:hypothetical protein
LQVVGTHQHNANALLLLTAHKCEKNMKEKRKRMHGQFLRSLDDVLADKEQTY